MKLQKLYAPIMFLSLITTLSAHGMEENTHDMSPLVCLPFEICKQIASPSDYMVTHITEDNADKLIDQIKVFFMFKRACKDLHEELKFPWIHFDLPTKNKMLQEVLALMEKCSYQRYVSAANCNERYDYDYRYSEEVSFGYKKYRIIALALVYSGADADVTINGRSDLIESIYPDSCPMHGEYQLGSIPSSPCLSKALHAQDELAISMLLNNKANPYQESYDEQQLVYAKLYYTCRCYASFQAVFGSYWRGPICFRSPTVAIAQLLCEKVDKQKLLIMHGYKAATMELMCDYYDPEVMKFWLDYGIDVVSIFTVGHRGSMYDFMMSIYKVSRITIDKYLKKAELLFEIAAPDIINIRYGCGGRTFLDRVLSDDHERISVHDNEKIIALFRKYGGKTAQELEAEKLTTEQKIS